MADFNRLLTLLESELREQETLLELLSQERVAIVKLNKAQIDELRGKKEKVIASAQSVGQKRALVVEELTQQESSQVKLADIVKLCTERDVRSRLEKIGKDLQSTAYSVVEMNSHNAELIKQSMGLVASTLAIFRAASGTDLPTYSSSGTLQTAKETPSTSRATTLARDV